MVLLGGNYIYIILLQEYDMKSLKRAKLMLGIVAFGLVVSGVTVWPAVPELKIAVRVVWGDSQPTGGSH